MKLKDLTQEELQTMAYDEIAYLILEETGKKMKLLDLFKKVCKALNLPESVVEDRIADFFQLLSINKKFVLLKNGYWDLATKHKQDIVIEDEDEIIDEDMGNEDEEIIEEEENEDIFYDNELDNDDEEEDDLKDLVIIDDEENIQE